MSKNILVCEEGFSTHDIDWSKMDSDALTDFPHVPVVALLGTRTIRRHQPQTQPRRRKQKVFEFLTSQGSCVTVVLQVRIESSGIGF